VNVCQFHPLGSYWRTHFCEVAHSLGITMHEVVVFCSDSCYYHGVHDDGSACGQTRADEHLGALSATTGQRDLPDLIPALTPIGVPELETIGHQTRPWAKHGSLENLVEFHHFDMSTWSCRGKCPHGGCCKKADCKDLCYENPHLHSTCHSFKFDAKTLTCQLFRQVTAHYSSLGGHSGPGFWQSLLYMGATLPEAPFTITARIRSVVRTGCQDIIAWSDGQASWIAVEFRLNEGKLMYGENPFTDPKENSWKEVQSQGMLADSAWHNVAVVRERSGKVSLFAEGAHVAEGKVSPDVPAGLRPNARSARVSRFFQDCVLNGDVSRLQIFDSALNASLLAAIAGASNHGNAEDGHAHHWLAG